MRKLFLILILILAIGSIIFFVTDSNAQQVNNLNEPGSLLVYPLIDNINFQTIINIANTGTVDVILECYMVTHGDGTGIDEKKDFIIKMTAKEKFWWNTNFPNVKNQIQSFNGRKGYLFCWAIYDVIWQNEIDYDYLKGDATVVGRARAFNYNAIPSQKLIEPDEESLPEPNIFCGPRVLCLDGREYSMATSQIMFEGFAEDAFGVVDGVLVVANLDIDFIWSKQSEFDINVFCWNEDETKFSRHLHFKDFAQYDLTDDLQLDIDSIFTEGFHCATSTTHPLWAVFYQTAGPAIATGGNVWQHPGTGVPTAVVLPPVPMVN